MTNGPDAARTPGQSGPRDPTELATFLYQSASWEVATSSTFVLGNSAFTLEGIALDITGAAPPEELMRPGPFTLEGQQIFGELARWERITVLRGGNESLRKAESLGTMRAFIYAHHFQVSDIDHMVLASAVWQFRVPVFGSPPQNWLELGKEMAGTAVGAAAVGASVVDGRPLLMVLTVTGMFGIWFATPIARIARESAAKHMAKRMKIQFRREHLE